MTQPQADSALRFLMGDHTGTTSRTTDDPADDVNSRFLDLRQASTVTPRRVRWLWRDRIPVGELTLIVGRGGIGKSLLLATFTAWITNGTMKGEYHGKARDVLYVVNEDSLEYTVVPRLIAAGADLTRVHFVKAVTCGEYDRVMLPRDCQRIKDAITQYDAAAVMLDPISSNITAKKNDQDEMRAALERIRAMAESADTATIGLAHTRKALSTNLIDAIMGSVEMANVTRSVMGAMADPDDEGNVVLSQEKNNLGRMDLPSYKYRIITHVLDTDPLDPIPTARIDWQGKTDLTVSDMLADGMQVTSGGALKDATDWLREYLEYSGATPRTDVIAAARREHITEITLKRAAKRLRIRVERIGFPATSVWSLPTNESPGEISSSD